MNLRKIEARSRNHYCRGKTLCITYSECVSVALVILHAKRICRVILPFLASLSIPYFPHPISGKMFRKKRVVEHEMS